jgi:hypothetical protein
METHIRVNESYSFPVGIFGLRYALRFDHVWRVNRVASELGPMGIEPDALACYL